MDRALENVLGSLALVLSDRMREALQGTYARGGESCAALTAIGATASITPAELQAVLAISQPGCVRLVDRLVEDGHAERIPGHDGRQTRVRLTARGRRMRRRLLDAREAAIEELTRVLTGEERAVLEGLIDRLLEAHGTSQLQCYRACRLCDQQACERCPIPALK